MTHKNRLWPSFALSSLSLLIASAYAADDAAESKEESISVVGSRIPVRTVTDTAAPVDLISGDELRDAGFTNLGSALESLAPSFNYAEMSVNDGSDHVSPAMLRGLGPDQTLVLINGKRRHTSALIHQYSIGRGSAGTDFDAIPMSAVKRIEILRDGASAQYGSDAIAGVINIILKTSTDTEIAEGYRITSQGDGETFDTSINSGFELGDGFINLTAEARNADSTNRAEKDPYTYGGTPGHPGAHGQWHMGEAKFWQNNLFMNAKFPIGDTTEIYAFGGASTRDGEAGGYFRCPALLDADGNPLDDQGNNAGETYCNPIPVSQQVIYPRGTLPLINSRIEDRSLAAGVRFDIGDWHADTSVSTGSNSFAFGVSHSLNYSYGLGPDNNPDTVPTSAHAGDLKFSQNIFNFDLSTQLSELLSLALGAEARHEKYEIKAGDPYSYLNYCTDGNNDQQCDNGWALYGVKSGIQVFPGWSPDEADSLGRNSKAIYADLAANFHDTSSLEFALREEDFSDFGHNLSAKLAGRLFISEKFALRGSLSNGFRAPSVAQSDYTQKNSTFEAGVNHTNAIFRINSAEAKAFGIPELKPEKSESATLGAVFEPMRNMSITLDGYIINIKDRIVISGNFYGDLSTKIADALPAGVDNAAFFTNAVDTQTKGLDLVFHYRQDTGVGHLDYTVASSYAHTEVTNVNTPPGSILQGNTAAETETIKKVYFDAHERYRIEKYAPRNRDVVAATETLGDWHFGVNTVYYGKVTTMYADDANDPSKPDPTYTYVDKGRWIFGLNLDYDILKSLKVGVGVENIGDAYPKKQHGPWNGSTFPYSEETAQWGLAGRSYTANISWKF